MREHRGEKGFYYPQPNQYRKTAQSLTNVLAKENTKWEDEEKTGKVKSFILYPGTAEADKKKHDEAMEKLKAEGKLAWKKTDTFACGSCRWGGKTGDGCLYCNPAKKAKFGTMKEEQKLQAKNAIARAIKVAKAVGMQAEEVLAMEGHEEGGGEGGETKKN